MNYKDEIVGFLNRPFEFESMKRDMKMGHCNRVFKLNFLGTKRVLNTKVKSKPKTINCKYCGLGIDYLDVNIHRYSCSFYKQYCICGRLKRKIDLNIFEEGCNECIKSPSTSKEHGYELGLKSESIIVDKTHQIVSKEIQANESSKIIEEVIIASDKKSVDIPLNKFDNKLDNRDKLLVQIELLRKSISEKFKTFRTKA